MFTGCSIGSGAPFKLVGALMVGVGDGVVVARGVAVAGDIVVDLGVTIDVTISVGVSGGVTVAAAGLAMSTVPLLAVPLTSCPAISPKLGRGASEKLTRLVRV